MIIFWFYIKFKNGHFYLICQSILYKLCDLADEMNLNSQFQSENLIFIV